MRQRNKLDYNAQTNQYKFATLHPINLKLLSLIYSHFGIDYHALWMCL